MHIWAKFLLWLADFNLHLLHFQHVEVQFLHSVRRTYCKCFPCCDHSFPSSPFWVSLIKAQAFWSNGGKVLAWCQAETRKSGPLEPMSPREAWPVGRRENTTDSDEAGWTAKQLICNKSWWRWLKGIWKLEFESSKGFPWNYPRWSQMIWVDWKDSKDKKIQTSRNYGVIVFTCLLQ